MDKVKCLEVLNRMEASGEYDRDVIEDVCDDLGITYGQLICNYKEGLTCDPMNNDNLLDYVQWIRTGAEEPEADRAYVKFIVKLMRYRYEFYRRSNDQDRAKLIEYEQATNELVVIDYLENNDDESNEYFSFEFNPNMPIEHNMKRLDDFRKNVEVVINKYHDNAIADDTFIPSSLVQYGVRNYNKIKELGLLQQWDRYLMVWDLIDMNKDKSIDESALYLKVGKTIIEEFSIYRNYSPTDLRANIKKDYSKACQLIQSAVEGTFPVLKPKATPLLDDII